MPVSQGKESGGRMTAHDPQAAEDARRRLEAYQEKKAAEKAWEEREQKSKAQAAREAVAAYQESKYPRYVVQAGDSLSKIAKERLGDAKRWPEIQKLNEIDNPNLIQVGQELLLPEE